MLKYAGINYNQKCLALIFMQVIFKQLNFVIKTGDMYLTIDG